MPLISSEKPTLPTWARPYQFHGVSFQEVGGGQLRGDCPFCGKENKWHAGVKGWDCKVCGARGNGLEFIRLLWEMSVAGTPTLEYLTLAKERRLLSWQTLKTWGLARSVIGRGDWLVPGFGGDGKLYQLYRWVGLKGKDGKYHKHLLPTPGLWEDGKVHSLFGNNLLNKEIKKIWLCEGIWDAMALWEVLGGCKETPGGTVAPLGGKGKKGNNNGTSLREKWGVLAVPGCNVFQANWGRVFGGKQVVLPFDSDHPSLVKGVLQPPAGHAGVQRVTKLLRAGEFPPQGISYLKWGAEGHDPKKKSGWDLRDELTRNGEGGSGDIGQRVAFLQELLGRVEPCPVEWVEEIECKKCDNWKQLVTAWRKAMQWIPGLDRALSVILSSIVSVETMEDQLWCKIVGPPSCGKTALCEAISVNKKFVYPKDTITGLLSGYQLDRDGTQNLSLAGRLKNKTLAIKDGDTLLQLPNLSQVLSQFRAFYDKSIRSQYGNMMSQDHEGINCTVVLFGTESLRSLDTSELGERWLDSVVVEQMDEDLERSIARRKAHTVIANISRIADGKPETRDSPEMVLAKQLTGGYIDHLRHNAHELLGEIRVSDAVVDELSHLAEFVSFVRARPSTRQKETAQRELCFRLTSQLTKLGLCLAVVLNRTELDQEVMGRVKAVALDTARGRTLQLLKLLHRAGERGEELKELARQTGYSGQEEGAYLRFLRRLHAVELYDRRGRFGGVTRVWRLTTRLRGLCDLVLE